MDPKEVFVLENWSVLGNVPGDGVLCLSGQVYGNANFAPGQVIATSEIAGYRVEQESLIVVTRRGSEYLLGRPKASEAFAKRRLLRYLQQPRTRHDSEDPGGSTDISGKAVLPRMPEFDPATPGSKPSEL